MEKDNFMKRQNDPMGVYVTVLQDAYSAETQILEALPKVIEAVEDQSLKDALSEHLKQTKTHQSKVKAIVEGLGEDPGANKCEGMEGLLKEGDETIEEFEKGPLRDAALICACQKVEHYEMAAYGTLRTFAELLERPEESEILSQILDQETMADSTLTSVADSSVNPNALEGAAS